ncbi:hypothetical protein BsWGS_02324 [Bradybaena similaris]
MRAESMIIMFMHCVLWENVRSQPFYYEDDKSYYPDTSSGTDIYNLDPVEHNHDDTMKALADVLTDNETNSRSNFADSEHDITDFSEDSFSQANNDEVTAIYARNISDADDTPVRTRDSLEYEDASMEARESLKRSSLEVVKEAKPEVARVNVDLEDYKSRRQYEVTTEKIRKGRKHIKSENERGAYDFSRTSGESSDKSTNLADGAHLSTLKKSQTTRRNASMATGLNYDASLTNGSFCDPKSHSGCDVIHYERCSPERKQCRCLNGFLPENPSLGIGPCKAVSFYHGHIKLGAYKPSQRISDEQIVSIKQKLMNLIGLSLKRRGMDVLLDLNIHSVEMEGQQPSLTFELGLHKDILSGFEDIRSAISHDVVMMSEGEFLLDTSSGHFTIGSNGSSPALVEVNPCISQEHNHCSPHATCAYTSGSVSCQCHQGYEDVTPHVYRLPGEVCVEKCKCHNGGLCVTVDVLSGSRECSCLNWYFGAECQVNGKELLVICCCSMGSLVILGVTMCCCYYGCAKHKDNTARSSMFSFSPDISILKLPRVWMDTASYNDHELSPPDPRRMSMSSERSPYFDGYIMEDLPLGSVQRHGDNHSSYYQISQASLGHCPATISTHSFYRY